MPYMHRIHLLEGHTIRQAVEGGEEISDFLADVQNTYAFFTPESLHALILSCCKVQNLTLQDVKDGLASGCTCVLVDHQYTHLGKTIVRFIPEPDATNMSMAPSSTLQ